MSAFLFESLLTNGYGYALSMSLVYVIYNLVGYGSHNHSPSHNGHSYLFTNNNVTHAMFIISYLFDVLWCKYGLHLLLTFQYKITKDIKNDINLTTCIDIKMNLINDVRSISTK